MIAKKYTYTKIEKIDDIRHQHPPLHLSLQLLSLTFEDQPAKKFIDKAEEMDDIRKIQLPSTPYYLSSLTCQKIHC